MTNKNKYGERGKPWWNPLKVVNKGETNPFTRTA